MDPITAFATLATALVNLAQTIAEGQPQDVREQIWRWYMADIAQWRKFFKLDDK